MGPLLFAGPILIILQIIMLILELMNGGKDEEEAFREAAKRTGKTVEEIRRMYRKR